MLAYMNRTTVKLPEDLDARLCHEAQRRGTTISELADELTVYDGIASATVARALEDCRET
jgi:Ribbon-helix-helix protein, copG family